MAMLEIIKAYSGKDLQHVSAILSAIKSDGLSIDDAMDVINTEIKRVVDMRIQQQTVDYTYQKPKPIMCPKCGTIMVPLSIESLPQMLCKKCRYSMIVEDKS